MLARAALTRPGSPALDDEVSLITSRRRKYSFALYDAFSEAPFGGSQAAVITGASTIGHETRVRIARELGFPATAFVDSYDDDWVRVQFMSTVMELPMCGHGTVCLLTHLLLGGAFEAVRNGPCPVKLYLPQSHAVAEVADQTENRFRIMLDVRPPTFKPAPPHTGELLQALGLSTAVLASDLPLETALGDFAHLVVPLNGLAAMRAIEPNFEAIVAFCRKSGIETVAVFTREVEDSRNTIHVRDFCPAVGVNESAAAGTTNAALSCYLHRHGSVMVDGASDLTVRAEQGVELDRASSILSRLTVNAGVIERLQVGGFATKVLDGQIHI